MRNLLVLMVILMFSPALPAEETAFLAGVLRSDGVIVPFACYDGFRWDTPWPEADAAADTSLHDLNALPKAWFAPLSAVPREWFVRTASGGFRAVEAVRAVTVQSRCSSVMGLESSYFAGNTARPADRQPGAVPTRQTDPGVSKGGVALSRNIQTRTVASVGKESAEWRTLFAAIRNEFAKAEEKRGHPLPKETREREELVMLSLHRGVPEPDGSVVCRFEAARNYVASALLPGTSPAGCARFSGWIRLDRTGSPSFLEEEFTLERFAAPLEPALIPLGIISIGGKSFWVAEERIRGGESYCILEAGRTGLNTVARAFGGGC
ncbi:MAG: hypothetical protein ACYC9O_09530 [Candidatus Latescibacterota bacterium]